jgi:hypothetical protein
VRVHHDQTRFKLGNGRKTQLQYAHVGSPRRCCSAARPAPICESRLVVVSGRGLCPLPRDVAAHVVDGAGRDEPVNDGADDSRAPQRRASRASRRRGCWQVKGGRGKTAVALAGRRVDFGSATVIHSEYSMNE